MEEFTANVAFDSFADMPEFYGEGRASYRLAMVKHRDDFLTKSPPRKNSLRSTRTTD